MKSCFLWNALCIGCLSVLPCQAGRIVITESAAPRSQTRAEQTVDEARRYLHGNSNTTIVEGREGSDTTNQAEELRHDAQGYLGDSSASTTENNDHAVIILNTEPPTEAERARMKALSYVTAPASRTKTCVTVAENQVGVIAGGSSSSSTEVSSRTGSSVVVTRCK